VIVTGFVLEALWMPTSEVTGSTVAPEATAAASTGALTRLVISATTSVPAAIAAEVAVTSVRLAGVPPEAGTMAVYWSV